MGPIAVLNVHTPFDCVLGDENATASAPDKDFALRASHDAETDTENITLHYFGPYQYDLK